MDRVNKMLAALVETSEGVKACSVNCESAGALQDFVGALEEAGWKPGDRIFIMHMPPGAADTGVPFDL